MKSKLLRHLLSRNDGVIDTIESIIGNYSMACFKYYA